MIARSAANPIPDVGFSNSSQSSPQTTSLDYHVDKNQDIMPLQMESPKAKTEALSVELEDCFLNQK